jgi:branched-subunit amino acid ABC-type transport system permease component
MIVLQLMVNGVVTGSILGMFAISFSLIYATTNVFHVAHAAVFTLGSYLVWTFFVAGLPGPLALAMGCLGCMAVGAGIQKFVYEQLARRGATPLVVMIASLGLLVITENLIALIYTPNILTFPKWWGTEMVEIGPLSVTRNQLLALATGFVVYGLVMALSRFTLLGKKIRAVASNPFLAEIGQLRPRAVYVWIYAVGSMIVCLPSVLITVEFGLRPYNGILYLMNAAIAVVAAGVGSLSGAFFLAIILSILQNLSLLVVPSQWSVGTTFSIFVFLMLFRPRGLFVSAR